MTSQRFVQLRCDNCTARYPAQPAADKTAKQVRAEAAHAGWEVLRHTTGRDRCPPCRVREIQTAAGVLPVAVADATRPSEGSTP